MNKNDKKAVKSGFWYTVSSFITKGSTIITTPIFARLMSKDDLGVVSNVSAWVLLLLPLVSFDLYSSLKLAKYDYKDEIEKYSSSIVVYSSLLTMVFYVAAIIFIDPVCNFLEVNETQLHVIFLYCLVHPALSVYQTQNAIFYRYRKSTMVSLGGFFLSTVSGILFVLLSNDKATGRIIGGRGMYILISLIIYIYLLKKGGFSFKYFEYALVISFPLIWHTLSMHLLSSCDRIVITKYCGSEKAALYSIAYTAAHAISLLYHSLGNAWSPWALDQIHTDRYEKHKKVSNVYALLFMVMAVGLLLVGPEILLVLGGKKYMEAVNVIPPALLAVVPQMVYSLYINSENYMKKQKFIAIGTMGAGLINLVLNVIFIPKFGYVAAAYTTFAGYFFLYLFHYFICMKIGMKRFYDSKLYFLIILASIAMIPTSIWLYAHTIIRYIAVAVYFMALITAAILFRDKIALAKDMFFTKKNVKV